ncbi:MAG: peptide chain release factor N(5)-glutamine methyltransferase [Candidatus Pacebacteria bacterium]|nr:peptide chain release factor N(5)-glutamine methyltransferase [Candidatus Paceibacterota bacterium]
MEKINLKQKIDFILRDKYGLALRQGLEQENLLIGRNKQEKKLMADIKRLKAGEPLDYIIGWTPFLNCKIDLSQEPLIPRPETEYWTEQAIINIRQSLIVNNKKISILDIFSGSGCVGIAILKNIPGVQVDFAEIDPKLIKQIKINLKLNKISLKRYKVIQSDIFQKVKGKLARPNPLISGEGGYDFILANPPYVPGGKINRDVIKYEPKRALFGGKDGLDIIRKLLKQAPKHLNTGGQLWIEFSSEQKMAIEKLIKQNNMKGEFYKDQYDRWRWVVTG